ncbi:2OGFeDO, oxygenase domain containing protein [uncultured Caudovirales phage]|uniref:2OGFeDO, oxygenase domain containing protein n=1 Tax=uncultured Caudovirales phage TaxID=2100421 RepID=A0A6J7WWT4_9CAUD|nr:2OGFeDO, oxygenase domain containing protein [uncultured Caudovirales phage]
MVKVIVAKQKDDMSHMLGQFPDESHYDFLIEEDCDVYMPEIPGHPEMTYSEERIVLKFRKNYFTQEQQDQAYIGLREAAIETQNRGMAAGPRAEKLGNREWVTEYEYAVIDYFTNPGANLYGDDPIEDIREEFRGKKEAPSTRNNVWGIQAVKRDNFVFEDWVDATKVLSDDDMIAEAKRISDKYVCATTYANGVMSGIAGWFDRYPRLPYGRATSYTTREPEKFAMAFPFLQQLATGFKDLLPWRYNNQMEAAKKLDPRFLVPETPFTTITVNKSFRTACHFDAGDFTNGLSNLLTLTNNGNYRGCYLVAPEYRVAVNPRPGDLLLINNHEVMHGNTQIELLDDVAERISLVVYFREKMLELGSKEYEDCRYEYVESRRLNKEHPGHNGRNLWNGIDAGMWDSKEWHTYLESKLGSEVLNKYHPPKTTTVGALEEFFG